MKRRKHLNLSLLVRRVLGLSREPEARGYVEKLDTSEISGWALRRDGRPVQLLLRVNDSAFPLSPRWVSRADVSEKHGWQSANPGFLCRIPVDAAIALENALSADGAIEVVADGVSLKNRFAVSPAPVALQNEKLGLALETAGAVGLIQTWGHFTIHGWLEGKESSTKQIDLKCNGKLLGVKKISARRPEAPQTGGKKSLEVIEFEIDIPGVVWEGLSPAKEAKLEFEMGGTPLKTASLNLSRERVLAWIKDVAVMPMGPEKQYRGLIALEHLHHARLYADLDEKTRSFVDWFAKEMRVESLLPTKSGADRDAAIPGESVSTLMLWEAMRELNGRLLSNKEKAGVYAQISSVLSDQALAGEAKDWFLYLAAQLTCESGEFHRLSGQADLRKLQALAHSEVPEQLTLSLPALVVDERIEEAADVLGRLRSRIWDGWLHTHCIAFAVEEVRRLALQGDVGPEVLENFYVAFCSLLDGYSGEWFSRLHDSQLISAMACIVSGSDCFSDKTRDEVAASAIRHYGLCPTFWNRLDTDVAGNLPADVVHAKAHWENIRSFINDWPTLMGSQIEDSDDVAVFEIPENDLRSEVNAVDWLRQLPCVIQSIGWFRQRGSREAATMLREVAMNLGPLESGRSQNLAADIVRELSDIGDAEMLRLAASPLAFKEDLLNCSSHSWVKLSRTLLPLSECPKSPVRELQFFAAEALRRAYSGDNGERSGALGLLKARAVRLSSLDGGFLGIDLLASAYLIADEADLESGTYLALILTEFKRVVESIEAGSYLPAAVDAGLARLSGAPDSPLLSACQREIASLRQGKLPDFREDTTLPLKSRPKLSPHRNSPYGDTLVAIVTGHEEPDHVQAFRQTWLTDLSAIAVPYLIVVAGSSDVLSGDVLTLKVSREGDETEALSLRLFEWLYTHTDYQYVLRIHSNCYLDVEGYFNSLSYRKHHYHGRMIRSGIGNLDRLSCAEGKREIIDRSPEPSVYADGSCGYSLSRQALFQLVQAQKTIAGARVKAFSCDEDKLVGDLLALRDIHLSNEDYQAFVQRLSAPDAMPVAKGENTFFPSAVSPTVFAHMGREQDLKIARDRAHKNALWPKKIWPTCWAPLTGHNSNQLELVSELEKTGSLLRESLVVVAVVRNEMTMLPSFLEYYRGLGVRCFIFVDNYSDDGSREFLNEQADVVLFSVDTEYKHSHYGVTWQQAVLGNFCIGKWVVLADADEFLVYQGCDEERQLTELAQDIDNEGRDGALVYMIDMYPYGDLDDACFEKEDPFVAAPYFDRDALLELKFGGGNFSNSRNFVNGLRHRVAPSRINAYVSQKYALFKYKPWMRMTEGVHYAANMEVSDIPVFFAHFKYHSGFKEKVQTEIKRNQHFNGAEEYRRYASMLSEGAGGFGQPDKSVRYESSKSFVNLLESKR